LLHSSTNRIWITVSTRIQNWMTAMRPDIADGYIALYDGKGLRVVADTTRRMDARFHAGTPTTQEMLQWGGKVAPWFASVTFGGKDLRTAFIGSLRGTFSIPPRVLIL
jgi:hypothetical protein